MRLVEATLAGSANRLMVSPLALTTPIIPGIGLRLPLETMT
jgi:hypothetical protein